MGSPGMALVLLVQFWDLQGATGLDVQQQEPKLLVVRPGSLVTLTCYVNLSTNAWEKIRAEWTKDNVTLCQSLITHNSTKQACGPRGQFSWQLPNKFTLRLEHVNVNDSGHYVCRATLEIPLLEEAKGRGTELQVETDLIKVKTSTSAPPPGMHPAVLAGCVLLVLTAIALGAGIWIRRRRRRQQESENSLYSNVPYQRRRCRGAPKKTEVWAAEGREQLDIPREHQTAESFYSTSFPRPPLPRPPIPQPPIPRPPSPWQNHSPTPSPCPSPRPRLPISAFGISPDPRPYEFPDARGFL